MFISLILLFTLTAAVNGVQQTTANGNGSSTETVHPPCGKCIWDMTEEELEQRYANEKYVVVPTEEELIEKEERCGCKGPDYDSEKIAHLYRQINEFERQNPDMFPPNGTSGKKRRRKRFSRKPINSLLLVIHL